MKKDKQTGKNKSSYPLKSKMLERWENEGGKPEPDNSAETEAPTVEGKRFTPPCAQKKT